MTMRPVTVMCRDENCPSRRACARHAEGGGTPAGPSQPYYPRNTRAIAADCCPFFRAADNGDLFDRSDL